MLRVPTSNLQGAQQALARGAILTDTLVYYEAAVGEPAPVALGAGMHHRMLGRQDAEAVETLARAAFKDYVGHYHADAKLSREAADETYASWAHRSCEGPPVADAVLGIEGDGGNIVGFITLRRTGESASIELNAVSRPISAAASTSACRAVHELGGGSRVPQGIGLDTTEQRLGAEGVVPARVRTHKELLHPASLDF